MLPSLLDTTTAHHLRLQTQETLLQSQHLLLAFRQLQDLSLLTRDQARLLRQRAIEQQLRNHQLRAALAFHQGRFASLMGAKDLLYAARRPVSTVRLPAPETLDSLSLIERCQTGEPHAWNALVRRYEPVIFSFARSLCGNAHDASDITAEVLVRLFTSLHTFRRGAPSFKSWLFRIIHNTYVDVCIRDSDHGHLSLDTPLSQAVGSDSHEVVDASPTPEALLLSQDHLQRLAAGLKSLPYYQRQVLMLLVRGRSYEEIATQTGLSMGTVKSRLNRARKTLQARLEDDERLPDRKPPPL